MRIQEKDEYLFFEFLLELASADIENTKDSFLVSILFEYSKHVGHLAYRYAVISPERYSQIMSGLVTDENIMQERRQGLLKLQTRLHAIFEKAISTSDKPLIKMAGNQELSINNGKFVSQFVPNKIKRDTLDWNEEIVLIDIFFMDLVSELELIPERFNKCARCNNYFYQYSAKEKKYCSPRCSNAARQAVFQSKQVKEEAKSKSP